MLRLPAWMYIYAIKNAVVELIKIVMPDKVYEVLHKRRLHANK